MLIRMVGVRSWEMCYITEGPHKPRRLCVCALFLTLDVYLLHLIDFCDGFPKLFCKLPQLFSTWGAEAHQLLLL